MQGGKAKHNFGIVSAREEVMDATYFMYFGTTSRKNTAKKIEIFLRYLANRPPTPLSVLKIPFSPSGRQWPFCVVRYKPQVDLVLDLGRAVLASPLTPPKTRHTLTVAPGHRCVRRPNTTRRQPASQVDKGAAADAGGGRARGVNREKTALAVYWLSEIQQ